MQRRRVRVRALWQVLRTKAHKLIDRVRRRPPLHPAAATKVVQDISPFNFLALPPELREAIYERTLIRRGPRHLDVHIDPTTKCFERPRVVFEDLPNISLLLASKQVQEEYWQIVKRHTTVNVISEGTWDLSRLAEWLPHGVTLPLLKQLQSWTITLMYCSWANSARRHLYTDPRYWDAQVVGIGQPLLGKLFRCMHGRLQPFMPDEPRTTLEVDFGCGPDRFGTMPSIGYRMVDAIDPQGLRAVLESGRIKVVFVAHSALYFTPTCTEESGAEVEFDVSEFWKFASREYVRWRLEPSRAPENIGGFTWAMDFVYPRYAAPRSDVMANLCKFASGGWMPDEVYGPVVP